MAYVPERGDVIRITLNPQAGRRPAVVLSPSSYNAKVSLAALCPITTHIKGYPFEVKIPEDLPASGVILADQVRSLDWRKRQAEYICTLPAETVLDVLERLGTLLTVQTT